MMSLLLVDDDCPKYSQLPKRKQPRSLAFLALQNPAARPISTTPLFPRLYKMEDDDLAQVCSV